MGRRMFEEFGFKEEIELMKLQHRMDTFQGRQDAVNEDYLYSKANPFSVI